MQLYDYRADAQRVYETLLDRGIGIVPTDVGYVIVACDPDAIWKIFEVKKRKPDKLNAICGCKAMHLELHDLPDDRRAIVSAVTEAYDLPMGTAREGAFSTTLRSPGCGRTCLNRRPTRARSRCF